MKLNLKQPKYIIPIGLIPFFLFFFYVGKSFESEDEPVVVGKDSFQENIGDVSPEVSKNEMADKLKAYEDAYKEGDKYTAITGIQEEDEKLPEMEDLYSKKEKRNLDSIESEFRKAAAEQALNQKRNSGSGYVERPNTRSQSKQTAEQELMDIVMGKTTPQSQREAAPPRKEYEPPDPLQTIKDQYRVIDSLNKLEDPEYLEEQKRQLATEKFEKEKERRRLNKLTVQKASVPKNGFNTVMRKDSRSFIKAIIDENVVGYAGSRIRIRLLEDIKVGNTVIKKGSYLYALVSGFSEQRVTMTISSVLYNNSILPINLNLYDLDGMEGLYVPASAFREFTKELGSTSIQGLNMQQSNTQTQSEFLMSSLQKAFTSTSQAIANAIRKNKAKFKYNTYVYLIDKQELESNNFK